MEPIAKKFGIPFYCFPITPENKDMQTAAELALLKKNKIDFCVLARYMQIITPEMIQAYPSKIINIHHSFLPAFAGANPYHAAHARGVKIIGATAHYVTENLDEGPIIEQDVQRVSHRQGVKEDLERLYFTALEAGADLVLFGHTHRSLHEREGKVEFFNPGSIDRGYPPSYGLLRLGEGPLSAEIIPL